jgi:hypothetical protein
MIFAPGLADSYGTDTFPSITDAIYLYKKTSSLEDADDSRRSSAAAIEEIKYQISIVIYSIHSAISILREPTDFRRFFF